MISQFFIINKSGGMIYSYEKTRKTDLNTLLILTSSLHSIFHISAQTCDRNPICQTIYLKNSVITFFRTRTNTSFVFVSDKKVKEIFERVYAHYCEYVLRNPFYELEMPINCQKFQPAKYFQSPRILEHKGTMCMPGVYCIAHGMTVYAYLLSAH